MRFLKLMLKWWAMQESNLPPADYAYQLQLSLPDKICLWSGLSLHLIKNLGASRQVSTPSLKIGLGSGLPSDLLEGFPEFEKLLP